MRNLLHKLRSALAIGVLAGAVAACSAGSATTTSGLSATVNKDAATVQADLAKADNFYGIAKGVALVAEQFYPSLKAPISSAIAVLDPLDATAKQLVASGVSDLPAAEALAAQISAQAIDLTNTAAPVIKVIPASAKK